MSVRQQAPGRDLARLRDLLDHAPGSNPDRANGVTEAGEIGHWLAAESIHAWSERNTLDDAG
jgi:hypothetical protein